LTDSARSLEVVVRPASPYRLPSRSGPDLLLRVRRGVVHRLLHLDGRPVVVRCWPKRDGIAFRAESGDGGEVGEERLERAIGGVRFALAVDDDLSGFYAAFNRDRILGPVIRRKPWIRPRRRPSGWEAIAWAITRQLIEAERASAIERRIVRRWGPELAFGDGAPLRDMPSAEVIAARSPAELQGADLSAGRSVALIKVAREIASRRADPVDPESDQRLRRIREVGPWTMQLLGLEGRGDADSLPAGDLNYLKLVGRLARLGRRATVEEVEEYFAPYEPYRGLAVTFAVHGRHLIAPPGPPLRTAA
jgi:DNA-3-methyladenine glycosylase II